MPVKNKRSKAKTNASAAAAAAAAAAKSAPHGHGDGGHGHSHAGGVCGGDDSSAHGHSHAAGGGDHGHSHSHGGGGGASASSGRRSKLAAFTAAANSKSSAGGGGGGGSGSGSGSGSDDVANTLASLLSLFPQNSHSPVPQQISTTRGTALVTAIDMLKPFADIKQLVVSCDPKRDLNAIHPESGDSPLIKAAERGAVDAIKLLLNAGAAIKQSNLITGNTAFHVAATHNQSDAVRELIKRGMDINHRNNQGETAILIACYYSHRATIAVLLAAGCDVSITDFKGNHPLKVSRNDCKESIQKFIAARNERKKQELNPVPSVVSELVASTRPFAGKMAALKLEAAGSNTGSGSTTGSGGAGAAAAIAVVRSDGSAISTERCAFATCGLARSAELVLKGCGRCRLVAYCTKEHQIADFKQHKNWCLAVKTVRDDLDIVCNVSGAAANERAAATQRLGVPIDSQLVVATNAIESLLGAIKIETDSKYLSVIAIRYLITNGPQTVDEELCARFIINGGLPIVLRCLLQNVVSDSVPGSNADALLDTVRFIMSIVRRHRLARLIINHYLLPTSTDADATFALLKSLISYPHNERVCNLSVGAVALLCEVDSVYVKSGLVARVLDKLKVTAETIETAQRLLKIDAVNSVRSITTLHATSPVNVAALQSGDQLMQLRKAYIS